MENVNAIFAQAIKDLRGTGFAITPATPHFQMAEAEKQLRAAAGAICAQRGQSFKWRTEYAKVAQWLSDNNGRGLLLMGGTGNGKTLMLDAVAAVMLVKLKVFCNKVAACDIANVTQLRKACAQRFSILDDLGTESDLVDFGARKSIAEEFVYSIEAAGSLGMISTNLDPTMIKQRYGERVLDRLRGGFFTVHFGGESFRKQ